MAKDKDDQDGGGFTGKRNKSWREIDALRGKSKYHSRHEDATQQRIERSASSPTERHGSREWWSTLRSTLSCRTTLIFWTRCSITPGSASSITRLPSWRRCSRRAS